MVILGTIVKPKKKQNFVVDKGKGATPAPKLEKMIIHKQHLFTTDYKEIYEIPLIKQLDHLSRLKTIFKLLLNCSYVPIEEAETMSKKYGLILDRELSDFNTFIYYDTYSEFPIIVHRGSVTPQDWLIDDVSILTGISNLVDTPRMRSERLITKKVELKYNKPADAFGHSLGGFIAENSGANGYILTYNKAAGFGDILKTKNPKQIDYRNKKDIVSLLSETQFTKIKYIDENASFLDAHSLSILPDVVNRRV